jgi:hypothetical protein
VDSMVCYLVETSSSRRKGKATEWTTTEIQNFPGRPNWLSVLALYLDGEKKKPGPIETQTSRTLESVFEVWMINKMDIVVANLQDGLF